MTPQTTPIVGNFDLGEHPVLAKCIHGHRTRLFNIGRDHYMACDTCKTVIHVGSNIMGWWRYENEAIWKRNSDKVQDYTLLER